MDSLSVMEPVTLESLASELERYMESSLPALDAWERALSILTLAREEEFTTEDRLIANPVLIKILGKMIEYSYLMKTWEEFYAELNESTFAHCASMASMLMYANKIVCNHFGIQAPLAFRQEDFLPMMAKALAYASIRQNEIKLLFLNHLLDKLPSAAQVQFCVFVCINNDKFKAIVNIFAGKWALFAAEKVTKMYDKLSSEKQRTNVADVVPVLVWKILQDSYSAVEVVDALLMKQAMASDAVRILVKSFPSEDMPVIIEQVALVWSDKLFIDRGDLAMMESLTNALLASIAACSAEQLESVGMIGLPLQVILTNGVSSYLDLDSMDMRVHGMKVGRAYATAMRYELDFPEIAMWEERNSKRTNLQPQSKSISKDSRQGSAMLRQASDLVCGPSRDNDSDSDDNHSDDSNGSSEIAGYFIEDESDAIPLSLTSKDRIIRTNYLRDCLEMLRCPESNTSARDWNKAAMVRIPLIMETEPSDAADLCVPLLKELLGMANTYNLENFEDLRRGAVLALLQCHPQLGTPYLTQALVTSDLPLGLRELCVDWLVLTAARLANSAAAQLDYAASGDGDGVVGGGESAGVKIVPGVGDYQEVLLAASSGKSRVKRPAKLAASKKHIRYLRNNFTPVSDDFFFPLLRLLATFIRGDQAAAAASGGRLSGVGGKGGSLTPPSDRFNVISELFVRDDPDLTASAASSSSSSSSSSFPHSSFKQRSSTTAAATPISAAAVMPGGTADLAGPQLAHLEGVDALLPGKLLTALAAFTSCSVNTLKLRPYALATLRACYECRVANSVSLRRCAWHAMTLTLQAYLTSLSSSNRGSGRQEQGHSQGVLQTLMNVSGVDELLGPSPDEGAAGNAGSAGAGDLPTLAAMELMAEPSVVRCVDFAAASWRDDPDDITRALKQELLRTALEGIS